jgi:hypothetical protein
MREMRSKDRETRLFELANRQLGLLRQGDLTAAGLSTSEISRRAANHRLTRVHHLVYAFGHTALREEARWLAAAWTGGEEDVLSHFTAARFHGWDVADPEDRIHLSTVRKTRSRDDLAVHRVGRLDRVDVLRARRLRVTHIPRTLVDLADVMDWADYRALADALPSLKVPAIRAAQARAGRRVGGPLVRRLIEADDAHTKSEFERRFLRFAAAHGLPRPDALNADVEGHKADCVYRAQQLVVELDGRTFHARRAQMRADRVRDADYQVGGYLVLRLVWDDLHRDEAARTVARIRRMLDAGASRS